MGRLQCRHDTFNTGQFAETVQCFFVGYRNVVGAPDILQPGMLRSYARIIQAGTDRMGTGNLTVLVFHQISAVTVQYTRTSGTKRSGVLTGLDPQSARSEEHTSELQ